MAEHLIRCATCGEEFDPAELDQVLFHEGDHKPREATGIIGRPARLYKCPDPACLGYPKGHKHRLTCQTFRYTPDAFTRRHGHRILHDAQVTVDLDDLTRLV